MLAALAASGFAGSSSRFEDAPPPPPPPPQPLAESSASASAGPTVTRRRSQRLSAKNHASAPMDGEAELDEPTQPAPPDNSLDTAPSDTVVDSELQADFTDDEVDAEVFDDDGDPDVSISDKTVSLSIAEGRNCVDFMCEKSLIFLDGTKVEAQTPDGTRVATPSISAGTGPRSSSSKISYASALKAKPQDWHLEFSMDDHILPLDLTIYGAMHQHEMRKNAGPVSSAVIWQGIYTVKFKKVPGPLPSVDGRMVSQ